MSDSGMGINSETQLNRKYIEFMKLLNIYLNHFPKFEKYALLGHSKNTLSMNHLINLIKEDKNETISLPTYFQQAYENRCKFTRECNNTSI